MKTPDEIKKGLECYVKKAVCTYCPYIEEPDCDDQLYEDALSYIKQVERERDAAVEALCKVNRVLQSHGWTGTTLCMSELRNTINDGFIDVLCAKYEGEEVE